LAGKPGWVTLRLSLSTIIALNKNHPAVREWARADKRTSKCTQSVDVDERNIRRSFEDEEDFPLVDDRNLGRNFAMPPNEGARG
jgi:hypothetical protein